MRHFFVMHGISGSGKSFYVRNLCERSLQFHFATPVICSADDFFMKDGVYEFDPSLLPLAHNSCFDKFEKAIDNLTDIIILDNTNTEAWHSRHYEDMAHKNGYAIHHIWMNRYIIEDRLISFYNARNEHGVPMETSIQQAENYNNLLGMVIASQGVKVEEFKGKHVAWSEGKIPETF